MPRGRTPGARTRRIHAAVPARIHGLYVAELGGVVKLGYSADVRGRLCGLMWQGDRDARPLNRFAVYPGQAHREADCLTAVRAVAAPLGGYAEYFVGITFDQAQALVDGVLQA